MADEENDFTIQGAEREEKVIALIRKAPAIMRQQPPTGEVDVYDEDTPKAEPPTVEPAPKRDVRGPLARRIAASEAVKAALARAKQSLRAFNEARQKVEHLCDPERHAKKLLVQIGQTNDADQLVKLRSEHAQYVGEAAEAARQAGQRIVRRAFLPHEAALHALLDAADSETQQLAAEIQKEEAKLFKKFGVAHEATPITHQVNRFKALLENARDVLNLRKTSTGHASALGNYEHILEILEAD